MDSSRQARSDSSWPWGDGTHRPNPSSNSETLGVLNEIVQVALLSTRASAAAIALVEAGEMVCRATVGEHAPDYGARLNTAEGLSGACVQSRQVEVCDDAELDPRVDLAASRALGARSILVVPILARDRLVGIMELFSPRTQAFSDDDVRVAEALTQRVRDVLPEAEAADASPTAIPAGATNGDAVSLSTELLQGMTDAITPAEPAQESPPETPETPFMLTSQDAAEVKPHQDFATTVLTIVVVALAVTLGILLELHRERNRAQVSSPPTAAVATTAAEPTAPKAVPPANPASETNVRTDPTPSSSTPSTPSHAQHEADSRKRATLEAPGGLTVYQNDKVVFSMPPSAAKGPAAASEATVAVLAPDAAEKLLAERVEPDYPPQALAARIQGSVALNMTIDTAGQVVRARVFDGPPELAQAAADAVRRWRFHPYTVNGQPQPFRTTTVIDFKLQ
jgi:protein TonB